MWLIPYLRHSGDGYCQTYQSQQSLDILAMYTQARPGINESTLLESGVLYAPVPKFTPNLSLPGALKKFTLSVQRLDRFFCQFQAILSPTVCRVLCMFIFDIRLIRIPMWQTGFHPKQKIIPRCATHARVYRSQH